MNKSACQELFSTIFSGTHYLLDSIPNSGVCCIIMNSSDYVKLRLTPTQLEVFYQALRRAIDYEEEMVNVEARYAHDHQTKASIYRALRTAVVEQTDIPPPIDS